MTSNLSDRYVWAVLRRVPSDQRAELEPEIRGLIADMVDAHGTDERTALAELGDPSVLAGRYLGRAEHLIGPALYPEWRRLLSVLLPIIVPIVSISIFASKLLGQATVGEAIVTALFTGFGVALQILFWVTIVFAAIERTSGSTGRSAHRWTVDELPDLPDDGRIGVIEFGFAAVAPILAIGALLWVQLQPPIVIDGEAFPLLDPALWTSALPWFIAVLAGDILLTIARFVRGRWTWTLATVNALLGAAFLAPALYLWQNGLLLNPDLVAKITASSGSQWLDTAGTVAAVVIAAVVIFEAAEAFFKAHRASPAS